MSTYSPDTQFTDRILFRSRPPASQRDGFLCTLEILAILLSFKMKFPFLAAARAPDHRAGPTI